MMKMLGNPSGKRRQGTPRRNWLDDVEKLP
jgi:hypothetical protein